MIINFMSSTIFQLYEKQISFLFDNQNSSDDKELNSSINMSIILCSTCLVEGVLQDRSNIIIGYYSALYHSLSQKDLDTRRHMNLFINRILHNLNDNVCHSVGIDKYNEFFKKVIGKSIYDNGDIKKLIEPINVLFQLRNVLAHGREISAYAYVIEDNKTNECFLGGYKKAQDLLIKNGLLYIGFLDSEDPNILFSNNIAKYYYDIASEFINGLDQFIDDNIYITDSIKRKICKLNEDTQDNWSTYDYFRWRSQYSLIDEKMTYADFFK